MSNITGPKTVYSTGGWHNWTTLPALLWFASGLMADGRCRAFAGSPTTQTQHFDDDPHWDAHNNRIGAERPARTVKQDFGYSRSSHAGGQTGEVGGLIGPAAEPACYAKVIPKSTLKSGLIASGKLYVPPGPGNTLLGFFNRDTIKEWRTPNTIALRISGRGDGFHLHLEYCTSRWRAGGDFFGDVDPKSGKKRERLLSNTVHTWSLAYDPQANQDAGAIRATLDGEELVLKLDAQHKSDGATFNRFGLLNVLKSVDGGGEVWIDDLRIGDATDRFDTDPGWEGSNNRREYETRNIRPAFDFGWSGTQFAQGAAKGEIGGLLFRGDQRYPDKMAYYGGVTDALTLNDPLIASGKICLRRGVTDSTVLLGFFHATDSMRSADVQKSGIPENFLGIAIEGPSSEGFFVYPAYGSDHESEGASASARPLPRIYPDAKPHEWGLRYDPGGGGGKGRITVTLDRQTAELDLVGAHRSAGAHFNRFGFITTHIDGNGQEAYVDDLTYTTSSGKR